jgi:diguanylate cyclase (GGDEF)-like protein
LEFALEPTPLSARDFGWNHPAYRNFATIDRRALNRFFELGSTVTVEPGTTVMQAGIAADGIHLLLDGRLETSRAGRALRELAPGDFVGESSLFTTEPPQIDVVALSRSLLLRIRRDAAIDYMVLYPKFGMALCTLLVRENLTHLAALSEVYVANSALTEQVESKNETLRHAIVTVEQTARLVSQSPHPVLRISNAGQLLFANAPAAPILRSWGAAIGDHVPASWQVVVRGALTGGHPHSLELAVDESVFMLTVVPLADLGYVNVYGQDVSQDRRKAALIEHMALHDDLTGLPNRAALRERLDAVIQRPQTTTDAALILLDLEGLEPIRALFGHSVNDQLLVEAGRRLDGLVGRNDMIAALGANHFAILLGAVEGEAGAIAATSALTDRLSAPFEVEHHRLQLGVRAGISLVGHAGDSPADALKRADLAKHRDGAEPEAAYNFYRPELERAMREEHQLEAELRLAIGTSQIEVWFQPKVGLADGRIIGAEALARWRHPTRGMVSPERFIPIAEQTGMIRELGEQVLQNACRTAAAWPNQDLHIAVNLSALQLRQADIVERVAAILDQAGLPPHRLDLEITESLLVEDMDRALITLERLRDLGVRLSLDDFGTGYSCLSYLARLKFDKIKIDRSFVIDMHRSAEMRKIAKTIVRLGANLEMTVVAEGIELDEQWQLLSALGCTEGQGYLFSRPLSAADLLSVIDRDGALQRFALARGLP